MLTAGLLTIIKHWEELSTLMGNAVLTQAVPRPLAQADWDDACSDAKPELGCAAKTRAIQQGWVISN